MRFRPGVIFGGLIMILALTLSACSGIRPLPPEISLSRLQVDDISLSHATLQAELRIYNPNLVALTLEQFDYTLSLNQVRISTGRSLEPTTIASRGYGDLTVKLSAAYLDLLRLIQTNKKQKSFQYALQGNIRVSGLGLVTVNYPLLQAGEIRIEQ